MYLSKEALVKKYIETRSPELKEKIVLSYKPLVEYIARKLSFNRDDLKDLSQVGVIGLLRALERFDPSKEIDFATFATPNIIGEIKHYFRDKQNLVKVPRKLQEMYSKVRRYIKEATVDGRSPTVAEISSHLDIEEEKVLECIEAGQTATVLSLDSPSYKKNSYSRNDNAGQSLLDSLGVENKEEFMLNRELLQQAMVSLDERERKIVYLRYYNGLSQTEIAERLNLSQMHISRLLDQSIQRLKRMLEKA